jgi:transcription initiation factor TFIIB
LENPRSWYTDFPRKFIKIVTFASQHTPQAIERQAKQHSQGAVVANKRSSSLRRSLLKSRYLHQTLVAQRAPVVEMATMVEPEVKAPAEFKEDLNDVLVCPDCREYPPNLIEEFSSGDMVCGTCGLVIGERIIDTRSEWRTFSNDDQGNDDPSRVGDGANMLLDGSQLETAIAFEGKGARDLTKAQQKMTNDKSNRDLMSAYKEIGQFCDTIHAGKAVADAAKHIFKLVEDAKVMKGKPQRAIVAGCIFISCRQNNVPRTFREIFALTNIPKKEIGRIFKQLEAFLAKVGDQAKDPSSSYTARGSTGAEDLCGRYCSQIGFRNPKVEKIARRLAAKTGSVPDLAGRSPLSVAAACIYMASHLVGESKPSKKIADVAGVSDGTIKTAYRYLYQKKEQLIESDWEVNMDALPAN